MSKTLSPGDVVWIERYSNKRDIVHKHPFIILESFTHKQYIGSQKRPYDIIASPMSTKHSTHAQSAVKLPANVNPVNHKDGFVKISDEYCFNSEELHIQKHNKKLKPQHLSALLTIKSKIHQKQIDKNTQNLLTSETLDRLSKLKEQGDFIFLLYPSTTLTEPNLEQDLAKVAINSNTGLFTGQGVYLNSNDLSKLKHHLNTHKEKGFSTNRNITIKDFELKLSSPTTSNKKGENSTMSQKTQQAKHRINTMSIAIILKSEAGERMKRYVDSLHDYSDYVARLPALIQRAEAQKITLGLKGYQNTIQHYDSRRRSSHDVAMDALNILNRKAAATGIDPVYDGEISHEKRGDVANAIFSMTKEYLDLDEHGDLTREQTKSLADHIIDSSQETSHQLGN